MAFLDFEGVGELMLFLTSFSAGMSIIMGINAVNATPQFMLNYFKYIKKDEKAEPDMPEFWSKVLTYYTVVTAPTQLFLQPLNLTPFFRRLSLLFRIEAGSILMFIELLTVCLMPHVITTEAGGVASIVLAAFMGGVGRSLFENAVFGLFGPCRPKIVVAAMIGLPASSVLMSIIQITLLATMDIKFNSILKQSIIYFCVSLSIVLTSAVLLAMLTCNSFAKRYIAEFRSSKSFWQNIYTSRKKLQCSSTECAHEHGAEPSPLGLMVPDAKAQGPAIESEDTAVDENSAKMLQGVRLLPVIKHIYPMLIACFLSFSITCLLFPGVLIKVDVFDTWYITLVIATFNFSDFVSRLITLFKSLQISPKGVLILAIARIVFIPLLMLCAHHIIKGKAVAYIFTALMAITNGYVGSMSMMYSVSLPELTTAGERSMAGQICDIVLLFSVSLGIFIQIFCLG